MPCGSSLLVDLYELTMAECYFRYKQTTRATFDLFVRQLPLNRAFLIAAGLEDILNYIRDLRFSRQDIAYLRSLKLFSRKFLEYLSGFKFRGDIWAMPEGTIFFPGEPMIRVTACVMEAQLVESFLLNTVNLQTMIASKAARVVLAAQGKGVYDFSLRRTHGRDAAIKVARSSYLAGFSGTSNVLAGKLYRIPVAGTMAHSFVMTFKNELESFLAYSSVFPERTILLVDTYDTVKGIRNAAKIGLRLAQKGWRLLGIRLDSGNIVALSKIARKILDAAGLNYVKIFASGNLDEFSISDMLAKKAALDNFGVGTHMGTSIDAPALDVIYKLSEVSDARGRFFPAMKLSQGKVTYPGRKQVFRIQDKKGNFLRDVLALEKEGLKATPLLVKAVSQGKRVYHLPDLPEIRAVVSDGLARLPAGLKKVYPRYSYPVLVSPRLRKMTCALSRKLAMRQ
jgi:nicotinate phosphoribosyltransferase